MWVLNNAYFNYLMVYHLFLLIIYSFTYTGRLT